MPVGHIEKHVGERGPSLWRCCLLTASLASLVLSVFTIYDSKVRYETYSAQNAVTWRSVSSGIMSSSTADALASDQLLKRNWLAIIEFGADTSDWLANRYGVEPLKRARESLNIHRRELSDTGSSRPPPRPLIKRLPGLFDFLDPNKDDAADSNDTSTDKGDGVTDPLGALGDMFNEAIGGLGDAILGDLSGSGMFLGVGVGEGAAQGLNLTTADNAKAIGAKVLADNGMESTGLNPALENLGMGATASLVGSIDLSGGLGDLGPAIMSLASGVGSGAVTGLEIAKPPPPNGSDLPAILGMFGFGLASSVAGSIDTNALVNSDSAGGLDEQLPSAILSLAQGMGNGAVTGLKINDVPPPTGTEVPDLAGSFGYGLTQAVTSNVDVSSLGGGVDNTMLMDMLPAAASGLGKGLGEGIPIGLGLRDDGGIVAMKPMPEGQIDVGGLTENFAMGLTSRLLANDTISKFMSSSDGSGSGGLMSDLNIQNVAGGLARGLLQGAADGVNSMGGVQALVDGTATVPTGPVEETAVQFNDSVNGAAVGFGQGFGSQGVMVVQGLFGKVEVQSKRRDTLPSSDELAQLDSRQDNAASGVAVSDGTTIFNLSALINADGLSSITQKGVDLLTCRGVGGLGLVLSGISSGGSLSSGSGDKADLSQFKDFLPKGLITFTNEGHVYEIDAQLAVEKIEGGIVAAADAMKINGNRIPAFISFLIMHILFGIGAFFSVLPIALGLESTRNILIKIRKPHVLPNIPRWNNVLWFAVIAPSIVIVLIFGALLMGTSVHFRTAHGVLGLLTVILGVAAVALHFIVKSRRAEDLPPPPRLHLARKVVNQVFLLFSLITALTGFADLSKILVCLTQVIAFEAAVALGFGLSGVFAVSSAICGLDGYLAFRERRRGRGGKANSREKVPG